MKIFLFFALLAAFNVHATTDFSKLIPDILQSTEGKFVMDGKFPGSCGGEGEKLDNASAGSLMSLHPAENYIFFSLSEHLSNPKINKREFRFFKNEKLEGIPDYVLNEEGLSQGGKLKCSWGLKYSEGDLYGAYLKNCPMAKELFGYHSFGSPQGIIELCSVMNIVNYSVKNNKYTYQVKIGDALYYIDTTTMEELQKGNNFYSKELLKELEYKKEGDRKHAIATLFTEIKSSQSFKDLFQCAVRKDFACLDKARSKEFFSEVANAGYKPICNTGEGAGNEGPFCLEGFVGYEEKISQTVYIYMIGVIDDIYNMRTEKYNTHKYDTNRKAFFYDVNTPHTDMGESTIFLDFSSGTLIFNSFDDGLTC